MSLTKGKPRKAFYDFAGLLGIAWEERTRQHMTSDCIYMQLKIVAFAMPTTFNSAL
jgi:hypothetical protein